MDRETSLQWFAKVTGSDIVEGVRGEVLTDLTEGLEQDSEKQFIYVGGYAETDPSVKNNYVDLDLHELNDRESFFKYFMDGSRRAVKIAEFRNDGKVWPIVAGQLGVACCKRVDRKMVPIRGMRIYKNILSVPYQICGFGVDKEANKRMLMPKIPKGWGLWRLRRPWPHPFGVLLARRPFKTKRPRSEGSFGF